MSVTTGWDSIAAHLESVYPGQEPKHWGTVMRYSEGGPDPLDGISAYKLADPAHWHWVSFGMSELGAKQSKDKAVSGWGFEFSFRLTRPVRQAKPPEWPTVFLQKLARYVYNTGNPFGDEHYIPMGGPIYPGDDTELTALIFMTDPILKRIKTPNGQVEFLTAIGITAAEHDYAASKGPKKLLRMLLANNPLGVTDLRRDTVLNA
jgi:hypothetical protein